MKKKNILLLKHSKFKHLLFYIIIIVEKKLKKLLLSLNSKLFVREIGGE